MWLTSDHLTPQNTWQFYYVAIGWISKRGLQHISQSFFAYSPFFTSHSFKPNKVVSIKGSQNWSK